MACIARLKCPWCGCSVEILVQKAADWGPVGKDDLPPYQINVSNEPVTPDEGELSHRYECAYCRAVWCPAAPDLLSWRDMTQHGRCVREFRLVLAGTEARCRVCMDLLAPIQDDVVAQHVAGRLTDAIEQQHELEDAMFRRIIGANGTDNAEGE